VTHNIRLHAMSRSLTVQQNIQCLITLGLEVTLSLHKMLSQLRITLNVFEQTCKVTKIVYELLLFDNFINTGNYVMVPTRDPFTDTRFSIPVVKVRGPGGFVQPGFVRRAPPPRFTRPL